MTRIVTTDFESSAYSDSIGVMRVTLYPDIPRLEIRVGTGDPCVLIGEDVGKLTAWLQNPDYKLPR